MDFFERSRLPHGTRVMEVGCGWGLAGIYCAKKFGALVTGVDKDPEVFPYLRLHAEVNSVPMTTIVGGFDDLTQDYFKHIDVIIGSDICFWDNMVNPLENLVHRAMDMDVKLVLLSDPGRLSFDKLSKHLIKDRSGQIWDRTVQHPYCFQGKVLKIGSFFR